MAKMIPNKPGEDDAGEDVSDDAEDGEGAQPDALHPKLGLRWRD